MSIGSRAERIALGIEYLNAQYPKWWHRVDRTQLDMANPFRHVLAYVTGRPSYHTTEEAAWPLAKRIAHGFDDDMDLAAYAILTAEWSYVLRTGKDGRDT